MPHPLMISAIFTLSPTSTYPSPQGIESSVVNFQTLSVASVPLGALHSFYSLIKMAPGRARNDKRHSFTKRLPQQQQDPASLTERPQALPSNSALPNQVFPNESINNSGSGGNGNNVEFPGQRFGCPFCVIRDNDLRVQYEGAWTLSGGASRTTHSTVSSGASLSLKFNGTGIVVFGTVPASNGNMRPPSASYMVDDQDPVITTAPIATRPVPDQPLFGAMDISGDVEHTLVMRIIDTETPYTLEYFFVFPSPNGSHPGFGPPKPPITTAAPPTSPTPYSTALPSANPVPQSNDHMVRVLAGLVSVMLVIVVGALAVLLVRRLLKRLTRKSSTSNSSDNESKYGSDSTPEKSRGTVLTSTDSILRNNPSIMGWSYSGSRSDAFPPDRNTPTPAFLRRTINELPPPPPPNKHDDSPRFSSRPLSS